MKADFLTCKDFSKIPLMLQACVHTEKEELETAAQHLLPRNGIVRIVHKRAQLFETRKMFVLGALFLFIQEKKLRKPDRILFVY